MSILIQLPESIALEILLEWTQLDDVAQVDKAFCNVADRFSLISLYKLEQFCIVDELHHLPTHRMEQLHEHNNVLLETHPPQNHFCYVGYIYWICSRQIKVKRIDIDIDLLSKDISVYKLESVVIPMICKHIQICPKTIRIICENVTENFNITMLQQLSEIELRNGGCLNSSRTFKHIAKYCRKLTKFYYHDFLCTANIQTLATQNDVISILTHNKHINSLRLDFKHCVLDSQILSAITQHCTHLKEFCFANTEYAISFTEIATLINNIATLQYLCFYPTIGSLFMKIIYRKKNQHKSIEIDNTYCNEHTNIDMCALFNNITSLTSVRLTNVHDFPKSAVLSLIQNNPLLEELKAINGELTAFTLTQLLTKCTHLKWLMFGHSDAENQFTSTELNQIAESCMHSQLNELFILDQHYLTTANVLHIITQCSHLTKLGLYGCLQVNMGRITDFIAENNLEIVLLHGVENQFV